MVSLQATSAPIADNSPPLNMYLLKVEQGDRPQEANHKAHETAEIYYACLHVKLGCGAYLDQHAGAVLCEFRRESTMYNTCPSITLTLSPLVRVTNYVHFVPLLMSHSISPTLIFWFGKLVITQQCTMKKIEQYTSNFDCLSFLTNSTSFICTFS